MHAKNVWPLLPSGGTVLSLEPRRTFGHLFLERYTIRADRPVRSRNDSFFPLFLSFPRLFPFYEERTPQRKISTFSSHPRTIEISRESTRDRESLFSFLVPLFFSGSLSMSLSFSARACVRIRIFPLYPFSFSSVPFKNHRDTAPNRSELLVRRRFTVP